MSWLQFSIWDKKWPHRVIKDFLPRFEKEILPENTRWHFLYEPNLLVRVETEDLEILNQACRLAAILGYSFIPADSSKPRSDGTGGSRFSGDWHLYGPILWEANADVLYANSKLILRMKETGQLNPRMIRKHIHLLCNQSGRNYLQEFWLVLRHTVRCVRLFLRYGFH